MTQNDKKHPIIRLNLSKSNNSKKQNHEQLILNRTVAFLIDCLALTAILAAFFLITFGLVTLFATIIFPIVPIIYFSYFLTRDQQSTIGQKIMGLRYISVNESGEKILWPQAIIQVILLYMTYSMTGGLALLWAFVDKQGRCPHEIFSGTQIIRKDENQFY